MHVYADDITAGVENQPDVPGPDRRVNHVVAKAEVVHRAGQTGARADQGVRKTVPGN